MLMGLKEGQEKMSKSDPDSAIFMEDSADDVKKKIKKAYCPPLIVAGNPIIDYTKYIVLGYYGEITITNAHDGVSILIIFVMSRQDEIICFTHFSLFASLNNL